MREKGGFDLDAYQPDRGRGEARRHRLHHGGRGEGRPGIALAALRPDVERCGRYCAGAAGEAGVGDHPRRSQEACRGIEAPRLGVQGHAGDRAHARHSRRADHLWPEAGELVLRDAAQHRALRDGGGADAGRQAFRRGGQRGASGAGIRRGDLQAAGPRRSRRFRRR